MQLSADTPPLLFLALQQMPRKFGGIGSGCISGLPPWGSFMGHPITSELQKTGTPRHPELAGCYSFHSTPLRRGIRVAKSWMNNRSCGFAHIISNITHRIQSE
jgi:hypothetical protein